MYGTTPPMSRMTLVVSRVLAGLLVASAIGLTTIQAQIPGRNVNMVSGTKWPDGDPYLQRQNEPSVAVSTRNPLHLLAGANDYRTVDLPFVDGADETGDAWLGLFKSFDGGQRWRTTLLPGYPQDFSAEGLASPLHGYEAGADPVVRAGTNGLFYYAGLAFDRGDGGRSAVFVARYIDNNNREDNYQTRPGQPPGDPVQYVGTSLVARDNGRRFLDKPWIAVDIPRDGRTCRIPGANGTTQVIPAGTVYAAFSSIYEDQRGLRSDILLSRSTDCGATWSTPAKVNDKSRINQGASIAIDPRNGNVQVAWRKFASDATPGETDAIMAARSVDRGHSFGAPGMARAFERGRGKKIGLDPERYFEHRGKGKKPHVGKAVNVDADLDSFDQPTSDIDNFLMFRTNAYPSVAIDGTGRIYLAWAERGFTTSPQDDARIVITTSPDGRTWTAPTPVASTGENGHQLMPSLTFGGGRLVLVYYDLREDISGQFTQLIDDRSAIAAAGKRHTLDLRTSMGLPGATPVFAPSVRVSDYLVAFRQAPDGTLVEDRLQFNPPNLPMFKQGTAPFMGDYVDVAVSPAFVPTASGGWAFNTDGPLPVFHAVWTDNRDVRQPGPDPVTGKPDWSRYTPPTARTGSSVFDPTQDVSATCDATSTGSRNQNIYTARLSAGLVAGSPGNTKPLSTTIQRAFVVFAQNTAPTTKSFLMTIANQPPGGRASFRQFDLDSAGQVLAPLASLIVTTPGRSTAARSVYATSSDPKAQIQVDVVEVPYGGTTPAVPLIDRIILNPDIANPDIANPDIANPDIANPDIANAEVYNPDIANPDIANPDIANPDIANPDIANPDIANPDIANPDIANPDIANPDIANPDIVNVRVANPDIANPDIANPDIANPDIANPDIANPDIANPDIANGALTDVTWTMTNDGNTTAAFNVNLFLSQQTDKICPAGVSPTTGCITTQLVLRKVYNTPVATNCEVQLQAQNVLLANIPNPRFVLPGQDLPDQNSEEPTNATLWLAPGEKAQITLRVYDPTKAGNVPVNDTDPSTPTPGGSFIDPVFLPTTTTELGSVTPVVQQQSVDTEDIIAAFNAGAPAPKPPIVTPLSPPVPSGETGDPQPTPVSMAFVQQPSTTLAGAAVTPAVSVAVLDQYGSPLASAPVTLFVGTNPGGATLTGNAAISDLNGIAAFPALSLDAVGVGYTVVATSGQALPTVSAPFEVTSSTVVTNTNDSGGGSLRSAMTYANLLPGVQTITFDIPNEPTGPPYVIQPTTALPDVTDPVIIDGTTQPGYEDSPIIEIQGPGPSGGFYAGLKTLSGASTVRGLSVTGFRFSGIELRGNQSLVEHNWLGIRPDGSVLGNGSGSMGVYTVNSSMNVIRRNVIGGNHYSGVFIWGGAGNQVLNNLIGTDPEGMVAYGNQRGVTLEPFAGTRASNTLIGGNRIAGNTGPGIQMNCQGTAVDLCGALNTQIVGNTIGLKADGTALGNAIGINVIDGPGTVIGGPGVGNIISGSRGVGVSVRGADSTGVVIQANLIGLNADDVPVPNLGGGIYLENAPGVLVGTPGYGNVISGNMAGDAETGYVGGPGISVHGTPVPMPVIQANRIGTDPTGQFAMPNRFEGITLTGPARIGGAGAGEGNQISGNGVPAAGLGTGIATFGAGAAGSVIQGNVIGLASNPGTPVTLLPNGYSGITIYGDSHDVLIGGDAPGEANTIAGNLAAGIALYGGGDGEEGGLPQRITIAGNAIVNNGGLGIDLDDDGVTPNDPGDTDLGTNNGMNFPVLSNAANGLAATTQVDFDATNLLGNPYTLRFFASTTCDPSGHGEGERLVGVLSLFANGTGTMVLSELVPLGQAITATATDLYGDTSEFSACATVSSSLAVTAVVPAPPSASQMVTIQGTGLPPVVDPKPKALFSQGATTLEGFVFFGTTQWWVRLPGGLAPGPATLQLADAAGVPLTAPFGMAVAATPAAPIITGIFALNAPPTGPGSQVCGGGLASPAPAATLVSGQGAKVVAYGIDTTGTTIVFTQGASVFEVTSPCATSDGQGLGATFTVPLGIVPGPVSITVKTTVGPNTSAPSAAAILAVLAPAVTVVGPGGGPGGSAFATVDCPAGSVVVGLEGRAGDDIDATSILCAPTPALVPTSTLFVADGGGGTSYGSALTCAAGEAVTGVFGASRGGAQIDYMGVTCTNLSTSASHNTGTVGLSQDPSPFTLSCPAGTKVIGVEGRQGLVLDQISIRCQ